MIPPARALRNPVGTHVKVGKGLTDGALATARTIGAETVQIFVGNPRGWALSAGDAGEDERFAAATRAAGIRSFVHTPYLVNLGSPTAATFERSVATVAHNLHRAARLGAEGVVVHTGSCVDDGTLETALRQVGEGLLPVLDTLDDLPTSAEPPWLLLEPTAGQGRSLCAGVEDLGAYLDVLERHPRVGICLDTCHVFAAGAPLDEPGGTAATLDHLQEVAGPGRLRLVHANDSKDPRGSLRDRHEQIGRGHIGTDAFTELLAHPATDGVPLVLETPGAGEPGGPCLPLLLSLRDASTA
ncbi:MAG: deoxyribonuclease IV [Marmoricola sp.]